MTRPATRIILAALLATGCTNTAREAPALPAVVRACGTSDQAACRFTQRSVNTALRSRAPVHSSSSKAQSDDHEAPRSSWNRGNAVGQFGVGAGLDEAGDSSSLEGGDPPGTLAFQDPEYPEGTARMDREDRSQGQGRCAHAENGRISGCQEPGGSREGRGFHPEDDERERRATDRPRRDLAQADHWKGRTNHGRRARMGGQWARSLGHPQDDAGEGRAAPRRRQGQRSGTGTGSRARTARPADDRTPGQGHRQGQGAPSHNGAGPSGFGLVHRGQSERPPAHPRLGFADRRTDAQVQPPSGAHAEGTDHRPGARRAPIAVRTALATGEYPAIRGSQPHARPDARARGAAWRLARGRSQGRPGPGAQGSFSGLAPTAPTGWRTTSAGPWSRPSLVNGTGAFTRRTRGRSARRG